MKGNPAPETAQVEMVTLLQQRVQQLEKEQRLDLGRVSSGYRALDCLLSERGLRRGALVEWLGDCGSGATTLALAAAREACKDNGFLVVIDRAHRFYPPAVASLGVDLSQVIVVRPQNDKDFHWAVCQSLGCRGVGAVLCWPQKLDPRAFRAWQLAAETGGAVGLLVRSLQARGKPTWADLQLLVQPFTTSEPSLPRRVRVEVSHCRAGKSGQQAELEIA